ncbi:MerR family transcriptional regulator [Microvirga splendida]|uniref:MerR family transcriptional regulator n=1 Tax=Microvirga splendida TaxID=2795727 RepID=A0ABS0Y311_9HYPH|nr:MerR family transcriptional regulator [Microvirga splendida]
MDKSPDAFRTISEVADDLDVPQHVLRFWETRFNHIKPLKRGGGRRYYRPDDVELLKGIRHLLYGEGYTIKGVQRILKEEGVRFVQGIGRGEQTLAELHPEGDVVHLDEDRSAPGSSSPEEGGLALASPRELSREALQELQGVLQELYECDRVLASLRSSGEVAVVE